MSKCGILQPSELILVSGLQKRQKGFREKANFNRYQFYRVFFLGDPILQAHCVHTINAIDLRFFLHCVVEIGQIYLVPKIQICYKKYASNHTFSEIGRFCPGAHFAHKITFIVELQLLERTTPLEQR